MRRGLVIVISDFLEEGTWEKPLRMLGARHDLLSIEVTDPTELEFPDVGFLTLVDPEDGRRRLVDSRDPSIREAFAVGAAREQQARRHALRSAGDHVVLSTDRDWMRDLAGHIRHRRHRALGGRR